MFASLSASDSTESVSCSEDDEEEKYLVDDWLWILKPGNVEKRWFEESGPRKAGARIGVDNKFLDDIRTGEALKAETDGLPMYQEQQKLQRNARESIIDFFEESNAKNFENFTDEAKVWHFPIMFKTSSFNE